MSQNRRRGRSTKSDSELLFVLQTHGFHDGRVIKVRISFGYESQYLVGRAEGTVSS